MPFFLRAAEGTIEAKNDVGGGRSSSDFRTAKNNPQGKYFTR